MSFAGSNIGLAVVELPSNEGPQAGLVYGSTVIGLVDLLGVVHGPAWSHDYPGGTAWLRAPSRLELFLALPDWEQLVASALTQVDDVLASGELGSTDLTEVRLRAPLTQPQKIIGVALNYASHAEEAERDLADYPILFAKFANTLNGPDDDVPIPRASHRIDYEGELAVVIGRPTRFATRAIAEECIAGYAVANDVSARDYQFRTKEMLQGKTFDGFCPFGPWISKPRPVGELADLVLTTTVNGETRQRAKLGEMIFDVPHLVEYLSTIMTLLPGDVILTGTPAGVGASMKPRRWLRDGDTVAIEIAELGRISNRFRANMQPDPNGRAG